MSGSRFGVFGYRDFRLYWSGGLISNVGTWLQNVTGSAVMYVLTESPLMVGLLNFAGFVPIALFSLFGGVVSDRFDRRRVIVITHLASMSIAFAIAAVTFTGNLQPAILIVGACITNTSYAFAKPSLTSVLPLLVPRERLTEATGLNLLQFTGGQLGGSLLAALLLASVGPAWAFLVNGLTFLGPAVAILLIRTIPGPDPEARRGSGLDAVRAGIAYVRGDRILLPCLLGIAATSALAEALRTMSPILAIGAFAQPESAAGLIIAAWSVGSAISIILVGWLSRRSSPWVLATTGTVVLGAAAVIVGLAPVFAIGLLGAFSLGVGYSLTFTVLTAMLQGRAADAFRGRTMSLHTLSHLGMRPFSALAAGALASSLGVHLAMVLCGGLAVAAFALVTTARRAAAEERPETSAATVG